MQKIEDKIWSHYTNCYKIALSVFKCHDEASDIASEAIFKLLSVLQSEDPPDFRGNPTPYINKIVFNICKNLRRRDEKIIPFDVLNHDKEYTLDFGLFDLDAIIKDYPDDYIKLINMKLEGYDIKECSDEFGINENAMKVRWHRIKNKLKYELNDTH